MTDQHELPWHVPVRDADVLDEPDMDRILEKRMEVE